MSKRTNQNFTSRVVSSEWHPRPWQGRGIRWPLPMDPNHPMFLELVGIHSSYPILFSWHVLSFYNIKKKKIKNKNTLPCIRLVTFCVDPTDGVQQLRRTQHSYLWIISFTGLDEIKMEPLLFQEQSRR